jgi:hypothetical protein
MAARAARSTGADCLLGAGAREAVVAAVCLHAESAEVRHFGGRAVASLEGEASAAAEAAAARAVAEHVMSQRSPSSSSASAAPAPPAAAADATDAAADAVGAAEEVDAGDAAASGVGVGERRTLLQEHQHQHQHQHQQHRPASSTADKLQILTAQPCDHRRNHRFALARSHQLHRAGVIHSQPVDSLAMDCAGAVKLVAAGACEAVTA